MYRLRETVSIFGNGLPPCIFHEFVWLVNAKLETGLDAYLHRGLIAAKYLELFSGVGRRLQTSFPDMTVALFAGVGCR